MIPGMGHFHDRACRHKSDWNSFRSGCSLRVVHFEPDVRLDVALSGEHGSDVRDGVLFSVPWGHARYYSGHPFVGRIDANDRRTLRLSSRRVLALDLCRRSRRCPLLQCLRAGRAVFFESAGSARPGAQRVRATVRHHAGHRASAFHPGGHHSGETISPGDRVGGARVVGLTARYQAVRLATSHRAS